MAENKDMVNNYTTTMIIPLPLSAAYQDVDREEAKAKYRRRFSQFNFVISDNENN